MTVYGKTVYFEQMKNEEVRKLLWLEQGEDEGKVMR